MKPSKSLSGNVLLLVLIYTSLFALIVLANQQQAKAQWQLAKVWSSDWDLFLVTQAVLMHFNKSKLLAIPNECFIDQEAFLQSLAWWQSAKSCQLPRENYLIRYVLKPLQRVNCQASFYRLTVFVQNQQQQYRITQAVLAYPDDQPFCNNTVVAVKPGLQYWQTLND